MSLHEIDDLLVRSIQSIKKSKLKDTKKRQIVWSLEQLPDTYDLDAGGFEKSEQGADLTPIIAPALGKVVIETAHQQNNKFLIYHWSAFLLNYLDYFEQETPILTLKEDYLTTIKEIYQQYDFQGYEPSHRSLEIYEEFSEEMEDWFSKEQMELIQWFLK